MPNDIFINQGKYVKECLKKYDLDDVKHASTPMALNIKLDLDASGNSVLEKVCRGMTGPLLYLITSRLYIMFSLCLCA